MFGGAFCGHCHLGLEPVSAVLTQAGNDLREQNAKRKRVESAELAWMQVCQLVLPERWLT